MVSQTKSRKIPTRNVLPLFFTSRLKCDGTKLLPNANQPTCDDIQTFNACGGCQPTCENPNPRCTKMCHPGCFCPRNLPVFDNALGKCIAFAQCPAEDSCEAAIKADYLDSGNLGQICKGTDAGSTCATKCDSNSCVPRKNFPFAGKLTAACAKFTQVRVVNSRVQFHPHGGQSDFVWLSARTPHGGASYVW